MRDLKISEPKVAVCFDLKKSPGYQHPQMARTKQLSLVKDPRKNTKLWWIVKRNVYGGSLDYRKIRRPFDSKKLVHCVLKANVGRAFWFTKHERAIREIIERSAARYGIRIRDLAINHDHIHLLFYTSARQLQTLFLRFVSAELGRRFKALRKKFGIAPSRLWAARPFTRLVSWGTKSVESVKKYFKQNRDEAMGFVAYKPRSHSLSQFLFKWEMRFDSA